MSPRSDDARKTNFERIAKDRPRWKARNAAYYADDIAYMRFLVREGARILDLGCGDGDLLAALAPGEGIGVDFSPAMLAVARARHPDLTFLEADLEDTAALIDVLKDKGPFDYIILSDTLGYLNDCQALLEALHDLMGPDSRIVCSYYSALWEPVLALGERLGLKMPQPEVNYLGFQDIANLLFLADHDAIRNEFRQLIPYRLLGLGTLVNRFLGTLPVLRRLCLRHHMVARSLRRRERRNPSASVLVPCRNEAGNIEAIVQRTPRFAEVMEIVFVEGNSSDNTYEECLRVKEAYKDSWDITVVKQPGKGKGDAMRTAYAAAKHEVLMILDADMTMPPEELPKYYAVIAEGKGEFVNGTRLVYPMEQGAMRFLNYWANRSFALIFSFLLNQRFTDTLCGTKVFTRKAYDRISEGRAYFGDFDPFGDFDLIFGAAKQNLKIVEVPIRYADRTYGSTQINRFRDGWLLLKMVVFAWRKLKAF